jgi:Putative MetA-pathway of phenol degradation
MTKHIIAILLALLFYATTAFTQIEKIDTDRPDQTESPFIVPKKWVQFEMGFLKESDKPDPQSFRNVYFQHPTLLSKYGVSKRFELRLITEYSTFKEKGATGTFIKSGLSSVQLGGKVKFFEEKGLRPKTSLIVHYDFSRLRTFYRGSVDGANFRFTMQHTLSPMISLSYNLGMEWDSFGASPAYTYTFAPGFNISEKWYSYIEAFGFVWNNEPPENSVDIGLAYYVTNNLKLDISGGLGINKKAPDNYFALGASFRFKNGK